MGKIIDQFTLGRKTIVSLKLETNDFDSFLIDLKNITLETAKEVFEEDESAESCVCFINQNKSRKRNCTHVVINRKDLERFQSFYKVVQLFYINSDAEGIRIPEHFKFTYNYKPVRPEVYERIAGYKKRQIK